MSLREVDLLPSVLPQQHPATQLVQGMIGLSTLLPFPFSLPEDKSLGPVHHLPTLAFPHLSGRVAQN